MARTFNRPPQRISKPTRGDVQNRFFNQYEWKGMHTDKNFLTADQQTFQECNNVYADAENLLKSRPAIKRTTDPLILDIGNIVNFWSFNDVSVYLSSDSSEFSIHFVKDGVVKYNGDVSSKDIKLKLVDNKIWILDDEYLAYFNTLDYSYNVADDFIYVPKTKVYSGLTEQENESPNVLTNKEIYTYLYNSNTSLVSAILGKTLKFEMLGENYEVVFTKYTFSLLLEKRFVVINAKVQSNNYLHYKVEVSKNDSIIYHNTITNTILYSPDGVSFTRTITVPDNIITDVKFSEDGNYLYCLTESSGIHLYIISILASSAGSMLYQNWTKLYTLQHYTTTLMPSCELIDELNYIITYLDYMDPTGEYWLHSRIVVNGSVRYTSYVTPLTYDYGDDIYYVQFYPYNTPQILHTKCSMSMDGTASVLLFINVIGSSSSQLRTFVVCVTYKWNSNSDYYYITGENVISSILPINNYFAFAIKIKRMVTHVVHNKYGVCYYTNIDNDGNIVSVNHIATTPINNKVYFNSNVTQILTMAGIYYIEDGYRSPWLDSSLNRFCPVGFTNYAYVVDSTNDALLTNNVMSTLSLEEHVGSGYNYFLPSHESELSAQYWSKDNNLYISQYVEDDDGNFMWYFPKSHVQKFNYPITNLIPISKTEMGVFFEHEIWYVESDVLNENLVYRYTKSKLPVGMREGSDVIVTFDGSAILFTCERGLVMLAYQDLVASTEQTLTFASDNIATLFKEFNDGPIKLYEYDFWIVVYKQNSNKLLVYDKRTGSWYPQTIVDNLQKIITVDYAPQLLKGGTIYNLDNDADAYFDYDGSKKYNIQWNITSQKLHLGANNHYKHVYNITLSSVLDTETPLSMILNVRNYRKQVDAGKPQILEYKVDTIRTFVKRLNHAKINEFQYLLSNDEDNVIQKPLSLANISVKYKILEEVR